MIKVVEIQKKDESKPESRPVRRARPVVQRARLQCHRSKLINRISTRTSVPAWVDAFDGDLRECNDLAGRIVNELTKALNECDDRYEIVTLKQSKRNLGFWKSVLGYTSNRLAAAKK